MTTPDHTQLDADTARHMQVYAMTGDNEADHSYADHTLVKLLTKLGFTETVKQYEKVGKWYA